MEISIEQRFTRYLKKISYKKRFTKIMNRKKIKKTILYFLKESNYDIDPMNLLYCLLIIFQLRIVGLYKEIAKVQIPESEINFVGCSYVGEYLYYLYEFQFPFHKKLERCFSSNDSFNRIIDREVKRYEERVRKNNEWKLL